MIRRPPRSTLSSSSAASDVYKRQGLSRSLRAAVAGEPLVAFGAVFGHGAHQEKDLVDELRAAGLVDQLGQLLALADPLISLAQPDTGVHNRRGDGPRLVCVVLDDRHPGPDDADRWPVVDLNAR